MPSRMTCTVLLFAAAFTLILVSVKPVDAKPGEQNDAEVSQAVDGEDPTERSLQVYDIRDLLVQYPNFTMAPNVGVPIDWERGGWFFVPPAKPSNNQLISYEDLPSREELVDQFTELITATVGDPDEWLDEQSTLSEVRGTLIIKTTRANHELIGQLLDDYARDRRKQIAVHVTIVESPAGVTRAWLKDALDDQLVSDRDETEALLASVEKNQSLRVVASGRMVLVNGQRGYSVVAPAYQPVSQEPDEEAEFFEAFRAEAFASALVLDMEVTAARRNDSVISTLRPSFALPTQANLDQDLRPTHGQFRSSVVTPNGGAAVQSIGSATGPTGKIIEYTLIYRTIIIE